MTTATATATATGTATQRQQQFQQQQVTATITATAITTVTAKTSSSERAHKQPSQQKAEGRLISACVTVLLFYRKADNFDSGLTKSWVGLVASRSPINRHALDLAFSLDA